MSQELIIAGTSVLQETPDSPVWTFAEKATVVQTFRSPSYALVFASAVPAGAAGTGPFEGLHVVSSVVSKERGGVGKLVITYEGNPIVSGLVEVVVPPDEPDVEYKSEEFALETHPAFSDLSEAVIAVCHALATSTDAKERANLEAILDDIDDPVVDEFSSRLNRGVTHYKLDLPTVRCVSYYVSQPTIDGGGYFEGPGGPIIPPEGFTWLRLPDTVGQSNGSFWRITRSWQGVINPDNYLYPVY